MKVYTIIVTYNGEKWILNTINSLLKSTLKNDIIVVDNGSTDDTIKIIKEFENISLFINDENLGFGAANNVGLRKVLTDKYDYAFLLNQDAWVESTTIEALVNIHQTNKEFGIISPIHLNPKENKLDYQFNKYLKQNKYNFDTINIPTDNKLLEIDFVNAACWLLPRETISLVGEFDELFFMYGEDNNYVQRLIFKKLRIGIYPNCNIYHDREYNRLTKVSKLKYINRKKSTYLNIILNPNKNYLKALLISNLYIIKNIIKNLIFFNFDITFNLFHIIRNPIDLYKIRKNY
jgi:GT2 family glycosyltransferase